jgi:uncharacterized protein YbjT (DUF2867 family)
MEPMPSKRPIFLTGATGFLGRHLLRAFLARGHAVSVLVRGAHAAPEQIGELTAPAPP